MKTWQDVQLRWVMCAILALAVVGCETDDDADATDTASTGTSGGSSSGGGGSSTASNTLSCGTWTDAQATLEAQVVEAMNAQRAAGTDCASGAKEVAPPVAMDAALQVAARCHTMDMVTNNFFAHSGSNNSRFNERINDAGFEGSARFENIAVGQRTAESVVQSWMGSESGHCDAIMSPDVTHVGIGFMDGGNADWPTYWTATFGRK